MTPRIPYRTAKESRTLWDLCRQMDERANRGAAKTKKERK